MAREYGRDQQLALLADLTAMSTLALNGYIEELDAYVAALAYDDTDVRFLLRSAVVLYGEAFRRLGTEQGFDPVVLTQRIALAESRERWGVVADGPSG